MHSTLALLLILLPLGTPRPAGTLNGCQVVFNMGDENPFDCVNGSIIDELQEEIAQLKNEAQQQFSLLQEEIKQANLQHSQQEEIHYQQLHSLLTPTPSPPQGSFQNPAPSCKSVPQDSPSGKYWIQSTTTGYASHEYCDMNSVRCETRGWMRVANMNMSVTSQKCPAGFRYTSGSGYRGCGTHGQSCVSTTFPVHGVRYSKVCGRVNAYQFGSTDAFLPYYNNRALTIDSQYVDGVSMTHGQYPRKHIWTFAAAVDETQSQANRCPCTKPTTAFTGVIPPFIGQDYFCETGSRYTFTRIVYVHDPLWNGDGCGFISTCCSNPPLFCKTLSQATTDDIELRLCVDGSTSTEDVILKLVEIYVQ